jgi:hypothetical protein
VALEPNFETEYGLNKEDGPEYINYKKLSIKLGIHKDSYNFLNKVQSLNRIKNINKLR